MRPSLMCPSRSVPDVADDGVTELQEKVLDLLEAASIPAATNDAIIALIEAAELEKFHAEVVADMQAEAEFYSSLSPVLTRQDRCHCGDDVTERTERGYHCPACGAQWGY